MKKAFIFTLDALFAVSILAVFFVVYSFEMNVPKETHWLSEIGDTFMTSLDKNGTFYQYSGNPAVLTSYLNYLPPNVNASMTINTYTCQTDNLGIHSCGPPTTIQASKGTISSSQETHIRRVFADVNSHLFGIAELVLSYG